jgi:alpha-D-ribose 1-methylphosphonate 5-triphosphate diphosphatase
MTMTETILANATLVLPDGTRRGIWCLRDGQIADIGRRAGVPGGEDCGGDLLMPGSDRIAHRQPGTPYPAAPRVDWPHQAAIIAHDAELASVGITTVFDALRVGSLVSNGKALRRICPRAGGRDLDLRAQGALRISHFLHLRAEVCSETLIEELAKFGAKTGWASSA